jgi:hypothetical protein
MAVPISPYFVTYDDLQKELWFSVKGMPSTNMILLLLGFQRMTTSFVALPFLFRFCVHML